MNIRAYGIIDVMISNVLFDLDGTISNSSEGVIGCFQHTLKELTGYYSDEPSIIKLIGTPIQAIFSDLLQTNDEQLITRAISIYREKYAEIGVTGNIIYSGITDLLSTLRENSYSVFLVTMKNFQDAEKVIRHLGLDHLIRQIYGPSLEGYPDNKAELIRSTLDENNLSQNETVMIGDRKEDIRAGKANGIKTIGVTYGFGTREEIMESCPDCICHSPDGILREIEVLSN